MARTASGAQGSAGLDLVVDAGPLIYILSPADGGSYKTSVPVLVEILESAKGEGIPGLAIDPDKVSISVGDHALTVAAPAAGSALYTGEIDFLGYLPPLDGAQLLKVAATNQNGTTSTADAAFQVDNVGPLIEKTKPEPHSVIGQVVRIEATVTDPAGVLAPSVVAVLSHESVRQTVPLVRDGTSDVFFGLFDTRLLPHNAIFPSLSFRASDVLGNESHVGYEVGLDNTPPLADLDPPTQLRVARYKKGAYECSREFDPVGSDAVNDGQRVFQLFDVRARIEDQGNRPVAGPADSVPVTAVSARLLVLDDTDRPLVVDSDGDGVCDQVNPELMPSTMPMTANEVLALDLVGVPPKGSGNFTPDPSLPDPTYAGCSPGSDQDPPDPLCFTTDLTIAIPANAAGDPAVWTLAPVEDDTLQCVGRQFDAFANNIGDGWACLAVEATDAVGNRQVSRVLRVCIDHDNLGGECADLSHPPDCTGTVTAGKVSATSCSPWTPFPNARSFPPHQVVVLKS